MDFKWIKNFTCADFYSSSTDRTDKNVFFPCIIFIDGAILRLNPCLTLHTLLIRLVEGFHGFVQSSSFQEDSVSPFEIPVSKTCVDL